MQRALRPKNCLPSEKHFKVVFDTFEKSCEQAKHEILKEKISFAIPHVALTMIS